MHWEGLYSWLSLLGAETGHSWIYTLVHRVWGSAWHRCDPSNHEPSESPQQVRKWELCPSSKCCEVWGGSLGNSGAGESRQRLESHLAFLPGLLHLLLPKDLSCKKEGRTQVCSTGPSERAASLMQGLGASKIEIAEKDQNFCLKLLGFAFIALLPGMKVFHRSWF